MNQKIETDVVPLNKFDRTALLLKHLKNRAHSSMDKAAEAQAEADGCLHAYKKAAKQTLWDLFYPFNVYAIGNSFWIHDGPYQGKYFYQDSVYIDSEFNWYVTLEKEVLTAKGKPSKITETCYLSASFLAANMKKTPPKTVGAPLPITP